MEVLTGTLNESILRSVSLQANAKFVDELVGELQSENDLLKKQITEMDGDIKKLVADRDIFVADKDRQHADDLLEKERIIIKQRDDIDELNRSKSSVESMRHQLDHIDTFRNELLKERNDHEKTRLDYESKINELTEKIEYLQLSPSKRKKIDESKGAGVLPVVGDASEETQDGGTF
jgi:chromosome segregation ATPase